MIDFSKLRKEQVVSGDVPPWYTTGGLQLFYQKYSWENETVKQAFKRTAKAMAQHAPKDFPEWWDDDPYTFGKSWEQVFFSAMWDGFISCSTPMLANSGLRKRGTTVSCSGGVVENNLYDRYASIVEASILTKHSHGTSYSIDHWPAEGDPLPRGGYSAGVMPLIRDMITAMDEVVQGSRRGSLAYFIRPQHGDFDKVLENVYENPEANNPGWLIDDEFVRKMGENDPKTLQQFGKILGVKLPRGRGYFDFIDKRNRHLAEAFKQNGLKTHATNLCVETNLPSNHELTFSCVILNYNLELWDSWPKHLVFIGQVMSDCNISEYIETIDQMSKQDRLAMKKIRKFTEDYRSLGSGVLGFHTLMQRKLISIGSLECMFLNNQIFKHINTQATEATKWLAHVLGEPSGCKGLGIRNATKMMCPPTKSTAELMAGASEGIGLDTAMAFTKQSAGGEFFRVNKVLVELIKEKGLDFDSCVKEIIANKGSVQKVEWLDQKEKEAFKTAFEISMEAYLKLCSQRQKYIDQGQSINLYFTSNDSPEYIGKIHRLAFEDEEILSLYYIYSMRNAGEITRVESCEVCQ